MRERLFLWHAFFKKIRFFFEERGYLEVQTPKIVPYAAMEANIESITTFPMGLAEPFFLITSPEFAMKALLAQGSGPIFQITPAFREKEVGRWHHYEFQMLEWYKPAVDHHQLMEEVQDFLFLFLPNFKVEKITYQQAFRQHLGLDPFQFDLATWRTALADLWEENFCQNLLKNGLDVFLDYVFGFALQPKLGQEKLCFLSDFPISQAPFSKKNPDGKTAARFEVFYQGVELANGSYELNNSQEQKQRFFDLNLLRKKEGKKELKMDEEFLKNLNSLPNCSGVALGLDRLLALHQQEKNQAGLDSVLLFQREEKK